MLPDKRYGLHGFPRRNRRAFLADLGMGFTGLVLGAMLAEEGKGSLPAFPARAKSVIWLFMLGGVSHLEGFDPKPALNRYAGKKIAETPHKDILRSRLIKGNFRPFFGDPKLETKLLPLQVGFRKRGQSGIEVSDWWPHVGSCVDDLAVVRSLWTTDFNHSAQMLFNTGRIILDGKEPSLGSWVHYGLGTVDRQLPSFVVLGRPPSDFGGGLASHQASYLGPEHDGVPLDFSEAQPGEHSVFTGSERTAQKTEFDFIGRLNRLSAADYPTDLALQARIRSYELAFHMQTEVPALFNLGEESEQTRRLYGLDEPTTQPFARRCLTARRLVERGVRFIQIYHGGSSDDDNGIWDSHHELRKHHSRLCGEVDRPIAGLLKDLKQRGLLDSTLVVWASEFGRAPNYDLRTPKPAKVPDGTGRDHHIYGFSCWLAGAGIKGGTVHGATDELGFHAVEDRHYITDIHATVLHQLGLDSEKLQVPGRKRLELERGRPIKQILA
jgi:hypothetical protein